MQCIELQADRAHLAPTESDARVAGSTWAPSADSHDIRRQNQIRDHARLDEQVAR